MKPQPLVLETETESEIHVTSSSDAGNTGENNISQCGILSWGAPAIHSFKYKNGGLAEMSRKMYRSEEKRLDRIETNRLLRRRLDNATFWFASAERELERLERKRKKMMTPKEIESGAKARAKSENKTNTKSTVFGFFSNKSYNLTKEEDLKIERYEQISSSISSKRAEFQAARQKVRNLGNILNAGIKKASEMYVVFECEAREF